jgi:hypothetical protein
VSLLIAVMLAAAGPRATIDPATVREVAQEFATCAVKKRPELASKYVLDAYTWLDRRDFRKLFDPGCVPTYGRRYTALAGGRQQMSFALSEALVRLHYPSAEMPDVRSAAPLDHSLPPLAPLPASAKPQTPETLADMEMGRAASQAISILGECVVRGHPAAAHGLLLTEPGSPMESRYFEVLQPVAGNCIEKGAAMAMTKYSLRGTIALNYYRLAHALRATGQAQ